MLKYLSLFTPLFFTSYAHCFDNGTAIVRRNGIAYLPIHYDNIFYESSNAPMTSVIRQHPQIVANTKTVQDYIKTVEHQLLIEIFQNGTIPSKPRLQACTASKWLTWWKSNVCRAYAMSNWTEVPFSCVSEVSDVQMQGLNRGIDVNRLWNAINTRASAFRSLAKEIGKAIAPNITHIRPRHSFERYQSRGMQCLLHIVLSHRIKPNSEFHTELYFQNSPEGFFVPSGKRTIFLEYPAVINGTLGHNLRMRLPVQNFDDDSKRVWKTDATTMRRTVQREAWMITRFAPMTFAENPGIELALEKADTSQQQVANVLLPSTLAILFFPLLLTLIPISCFAYVSTVHVLGYTLLTDVITTAPLAIKGAELLYIHTRRFRAVVVRMTSAFNKKGAFPSAATAETWATECRTEDKVGRIGAIFLAIALVAFIVGTTLELFMFYIVRRRRKLIKSSEGKRDSSEMTAFRGSTNRSLDRYMEYLYDREYDSWVP